MAFVVNSDRVMGCAKENGYARSMMVMGDRAFAGSADFADL